MVEVSPDMIYENRHFKDCYHTVSSIANVMSDMDDKIEKALIGDVESMCDLRKSPPSRLFAGERYSEERLDMFCEKYGLKYEICGDRGNFHFWTKGGDRIGIDRLEYLLRNG